MFLRKKVLLGMSGGVDSSVAAAILKNNGYDVAGATFLLFGETDSNDNIRDAKAVCDVLGIEHFVLDMRDTFKSSVIDYFLNEYISGRTPNPCVMCNKTIKFGTFLPAAESLGFDLISTGHYAKISFDSAKDRYLLSKCDSQKDQSYFLYNLTQHQLSRTIFPLSSLSKEDVRRIASEYDLPVKSKADSQDVCFIPKNQTPSFLKSKLGEKKGAFISPSGEILGSHNGVWNYTIGQRKGFGIAFGKPAYVSAIDPHKNTVTLSFDQNDIFVTSFNVNAVNMIKYEKITEPTKALVKIRFAHNAAPATIFPEENGTLKITFDTPQRAVTSGQSAVFYDENDVIGGGTIL